MNELISLAASVGFLHAFEADHLVAVSNLVSKRSNVYKALKDGVFWGLGHTSILLLVGVIFMLGKLTINENIFSYFEAFVGLMLVVLGVIRIITIFKVKLKPNDTKEHSHSLAFGVGALHGLAGSGAVLLSMLAFKNTIQTNVIYLIIFGVGSIFGMMAVSLLCSFPFTSKYLKNKTVSNIFALISSIACLFFGILIIYRNIYV